MVNKLLRQITQALRDIKAGDVLGVYATIYGVIFIGAFAVIFQKNVLFGLFS